MNENTQLRMREAIRRIVMRELDEMTTTAAAGEYQTPGAFRGNGSKGRKKHKKNAEQSGYTLTKTGQTAAKRKADENILEGRSKYYNYKNNEQRTTRQRISASVRKVKKSLSEINKELKLVSRYKNEMGYSSQQYGKRSLENIYKIEQQLTKVSQKIREIRL